MLIIPEANAATIKTNALNINKITGVNATNIPDPMNSTTSIAPSALGSLVVLVDDECL